MYFILKCELLQRCHTELPHPTCGEAAEVEGQFSMEES